MASQKICPNIMTAQSSTKIPFPIPGSPVWKLSILWSCFGVICQGQAAPSSIREDWAHHSACPGLVNTGRQHTQINSQGLKFHSRSSFDLVINLLWFITGDNRSRGKASFSARPWPMGYREGMSRVIVWLISLGSTLNTDFVLCRRDDIQWKCQNTVKWVQELK